MNIKNYYLKKLKDKIEKDLVFKDDYFSSIETIYGKDINNTYSICNNRCHHNSYDLWKQDKNNKITVAWCHNENHINGFVHFLNYNIVNKEYIDNTLGSTGIYYTYYIFKDNSWINNQLEVEENFNPSQWLDKFKKDIYEKYCTNVIWKLFIKEEDM